MDAVRGSVLVVDSDRAHCQLLTRSLAQRGFAVSAASSGPEALALVEQGPPDLIILELALPEMDGFETLRRLRERTGEIKVMMLTAGGTPQHLREAKVLGVREFLGKPFDLNRLLRLVTQVAVAPQCG